VRITSVPVLGLAALASSPALWQAWTGALPVDTALTRFLVAVVVVWLSLSAVAMMVGGAPQPVREPGEATVDPAAGSGPSPLSGPSGEPR
jgi:hypothetical protein